MVYSLRNGFTSGKFTLPNRSECIFRNWSQDISTIEGGEIGSPQVPVNQTHNIGFWADELCPMSWVNTLRYRTVTRSHASNYDGIVRPATGIISFTAVDGWNSVVKSMLTGARTSRINKGGPIKRRRSPPRSTAHPQSQFCGLFSHSGESLWRMGGNEESVRGREEGNNSLSGLWSPCAPSREPFSLI